MKDLMRLDVYKTSGVTDFPVSFNESSFVPEQWVINMVFIPIIS
ncbi:MAG TPA: hypothetical protein PLS74_13095 [Bacteroidales bacterium]|nr:hypothetical protein [Bacteroidales bacterium]